MMKTRFLLNAAGMVVLAGGALAGDITPGEIFQRTEAAYASMQTYQSDGTASSDMDSGGSKMQMETSFTILLKKPNLYRITWTQKGMMGMTQSGAVWSDGSQPYLYMGIMNAYSKMSSDQIALSGATGISGGAAFTIPSLFLASFNVPSNHFARLQNPRIEKTEKIGDDDCYVISGPSKISKNETFWISKSNYLIRKYSRSLEPPEGGRQMPEMTDEDMAKAMKAMGLEVNDETKKNMRDMMEKSKAALNTAALKGSMTEVQAHVSSPALTAKDFQFTPPADAVLKDSLFGGLLGGGKP
jgi:outer membrane lipoprotein-sorting protein